jgi:hypothetical protein
MDEQLAGAGYILNFFENVLNMNAYYSELKRRLLNIKAKTNPDELQKNPTDHVSSSELKQLRNTLQFLNGFIDLTYIQAQALKNKVQAFNDSELQKLYESTETGEIPKIENIQEYVIKINTAFVDDVMQKLLVDSKTYYNQLKEDH